MKICGRCGRVAINGKINHCQKSHKEWKRYFMEKRGKFITRGNLEKFEKQFEGLVGPLVIPLGTKAIYERI